MQDISQWPCAFGSFQRTRRFPLVQNGWKNNIIQKQPNNHHRVTSLFELHSVDGLRVDQAPSNAKFKDWTSHIGTPSKRTSAIMAQMSVSAFSVSLPLLWNRTPIKLAGGLIHTSCLWNIKIQEIKAVASLPNKSKRTYCFVNSKQASEESWDRSYTCLC